MTTLAAKAQSYAGLALLIVLAFALVLAGLIFQERITRFLLSPRIPYQVYKPPPEPDYSNQDAWAAFGAVADSAGRADVFLLHPTLYASNKHWNAPLDDPRVEALLDETVLRDLAGPFSEIGRLFVPRYRQATLYTQWSHGIDAHRARELAFRDTRNAFATYMEHYNSGRPFFVVGLGQGGLHALGIVSRDLASGAYADRFVAAYVLGQVLPLDLFGGALGTIGLCETPQQNGCVAAWTTVSADEDTEELRDRSLTWMDDGLKSTAGRELVCVNPLTWGPSEVSAPAGMNAGARAPGSSGTAPVPAAAGAQCHNGLLVIEEPASRALRVRTHPRTDIRYYDTGLFWENIRKNLEGRLAAFGESS